MENTTKLITKWYKSKTIWFNILLAIIGFIELNSHLVKEILQENYGAVYLVIGIIGVVLRTITTSSIKK